MKKKMPSKITSLRQGARARKLEQKYQSRFRARKRKDNVLVDIEAQEAVADGVLDSIVCECDVL